MISPGPKVLELARFEAVAARKLILNDDEEAEDGFLWAQYLVEYCC